MEIIKYAKPDWAVNRDLDHWFNGLFNLGMGMPMPAFEANGRSQDYYLAFDLYESDDAYHAVFELPGLKRKDINVSVDGDYLTVSAERTFKAKGETRELRYQRSCMLPEGVDAEAITAKYKHGMLALDMPKQEPRKSRSVPVK